MGFPGGSAGKPPTYSAGDLGSIPGLGRSPREGKGYPLQCSHLENFSKCYLKLIHNSMNWTALVLILAVNEIPEGFGGMPAFSVISKLGGKHWEKHLYLFLIFDKNSHISVSKYMCKRCGFNPWVKKIPWRRAWQSTPVFLLRQSNGPGRLSRLQPMESRSWTQLKQLSTRANIRDSRSVVFISL